MKINKYFLACLVLLLTVVTIHTGYAQPAPPPPPAETPPCWPPPCVPVTGGLIYAVGAGILFGGYALIRSIRSRSAE